MKQIVDGLKMKGRDGVRTSQSLLNARKLRALEKVGIFLAIHGLQRNLNKLLWMNKVDLSGMLCLELR